VHCHAFSLIVGDWVFNVIKRDAGFCMTQCCFARILAGRYGNSSQAAFEDWVEILSTDPSSIVVAGESTVDDSATECLGVLTGAHLEILTAAIGDRANPQMTIVGARWEYTTSTIRYLCVGKSCGLDDLQSTQDFELRFSVAYVDVTAEPTAVVQRSPTLLKKLPRDFFYPFL
jgi:hypothetical protein